MTPSYTRTLFASLLLLVGGMFFIATAPVYADSLPETGTPPHSLVGFAWSSTIGWVSMSCANFGTCAQSNYGVHAIDANGNLAGYAWSPNIGWISFNASDVAGCPSGSCAPRLNRENGRVTGWARAVAGMSSGSGVSNTVPPRALVREDVTAPIVRVVRNLVASAAAQTCVPAGGVIDVMEPGLCPASLMIFRDTEPRCCSGTAAVGGQYGCNVTCIGPETVSVPLSASCSVSPATLSTGQSATWSASASGGTGSYTYSWSGTENLAGTGSQISKTYNSAGTKTGRVTVSSGSESVTVPCSNSVSVSQSPSPGVSPGGSSGWDGWIYLGRSSRVGVQVNDSCEWHGYAWGGGRTLDSGIVGWLSFGGPGYGVVGEGYSCRNQSTLAVSCAPSKSSAQVAESITWSASAQGGTGEYTYEWTGTDRLSGTGRIIDRSYATPGIKTASVTVTSGGESVSASCASSVFVSGEPTIVASCQVTPGSGVVGETEFTWYAEADGGTTGYTYAWEGSEGLTGTGQAVQKIYSTEGEKTARVTIQSGDESVTVDCRNSAVVNRDGLPNEIMCVGTPATAQVGQSVRWSVTTPRGSGYTYSWSGSEGLSGNAAQVDKTYTTPGVKSATVQVTFGGVSRAAQCQNTVDVLPAATISFTADRNPIVSGTSANLNWSVSGMQTRSCSITGPNVNRAGLNSGPAGSGSVNTGAVQSESVFTLRCTDLGGTVHTRSITMRVVPSFQEF